MILKGNQIAGATALAHHLLNASDNDHVSVYNMRGFVSDELLGAFNETHAISRGTKCRQFLFSLSLSPPETECVPVSVFEQAIVDIETKLGLAGQPRAIVFHEKLGRRHAHCVWSRIDVVKMRSINLPHFKMKLQDISRNLYLEHGWKMPSGLLKQEDRDPLNYSQEEWQQSKRSKKNPRALKKFFQQCWAGSDSRSAFAAALLERGLYLAKGDRRGHVAVDQNGEVYAISRWFGIKAKEVRAKLGNADNLPSVDEIKQRFEQALSELDHDKNSNRSSNLDRKQEALNTKRADLVARHRKTRTALLQTQDQRRMRETKVRAAQLPSGLKAVWFRLSGQYQSICQNIEAEAQTCLSRDQSEMQNLIEQQLRERRVLQSEFKALRLHQSIAKTQRDRNIGIQLKDAAQDEEELHLDPRQPLWLPDDREELFTRAQIRNSPERVLDMITDKEESFSRNDILRNLAKYIDDPAKIRLASEKTLRSNKLVKISDGATIRYSTRELQEVKQTLSAQVNSMASSTSHGVAASHARKAITRQNQNLQKYVGASLSEEQRNAINHVLGNNQLSVVVGLAGTGKSTMLAAAKEAWVKQGYNVRGATLSGKAADGLQEASGIPSRTLASLEMSWKNGNALLQPNDVLVIDEAGMVGTRQLARFVEAAAQNGAKLVLVGDPEQLQPINAGAPFRDITKQTEPANLTEIRRQRVDWQRQASLDLAQNRTVEALKAYADHGAVETNKTRSKAIAALVRDYMTDWELRGADASRLALAYRRKDVHAINQTIRMARKSSDDLENEQLFETDFGPRAFATGDRILFTRNDGDLGVKNGSLGTVKSIGNNQLTVRLDINNKKTQRQLTFSPRRYSAIDHGYATTIHKSQGTTVDNIFVLSSPRMDRHLTYVAMTRHRETAKLYADQTTPFLNFSAKQKATYNTNKLQLKR